MKRLPLLLSFIVLTSCALAQQKKALFVIVDGIAADLIEKLNTPAIDAIAKKGGFTRTIVGGEKGSYSQTPTISAVGYNTVLTGTWVNKHNVWDNDILAPNYHYPTIFRLLKEQYPEKKIGIFSSWLDNRTKLVGDKKPETGNYAFDYHFDGLEHDTINYKHDKDAQYMHRIDEAVVDSAASAIRLNGPDLSWVYLEFTDDMGHRYGDGPQYYKAIEMMDAQMGRIWAAVQEREKQFKEEWLIIITTDHGRDSVTGRNHGGQTDRERRGWIATNASKLNEQFKQGRSSIADIMPTVANFLDIEPSVEVAREIDGTSMLGKLGATDLGAGVKNGKLSLTWKPVVKKGNVKVWLTTTNEVKKGGKDEYVLLGEYPIKTGAVEIDISSRSSKFYKVVVETPFNTLNRWVLL